MTPQSSDENSCPDILSVAQASQGILNNEDDGSSLTD